MIAEIHRELTSPYVIFLWFSLAKLSSMFISTRFTYRFNCTCMCDFRATSLYNLTCEVRLQITEIIGSSGRINTHLQFLWREIKESIRFNYIIAFKKRYMYLQTSKERKNRKRPKRKKKKDKI